MSEFFSIISKMVNIVLFGGLDVRYGGLPLSTAITNVFWGYLPYFIILCLLTAGVYYMKKRLKKK